MTITVTVLVSAVTSCVVSIGTFIVGVRMAKDQGDRAALRQIYQRLFEHFRSIDDAIEEGKPKGWSDYPVKGERYIPVFAQMQLDGQANLLPSVIVEQCEQLESDALSTAGRYRRWVRESFIPALRALISERARSTSVMSFRSYRELSAVKLGLMSPEEIGDLSADLEANKLGLALQVAMEPGKHDALYLYPEHLAHGTLGGLLVDASALAMTDAEGRELVAAVHAICPRLAALLGRLKARIRDPHPLYESIKRSFRDAVRRE